MEDKNTQSIVNQAPMLDEGGAVQARQQLIELTQVYNPTFSEADLNQLLSEGTLDYFTSATPDNVMYFEGTDSEKDAQKMQQLYLDIRDHEGIMAAGGQARTRRTKDQMSQARYEKDVDEYNWYVIEKATNKVLSGYETREDAEEYRKDFDVDENDKDLKEYRTVAKRTLEKMGIENPNAKWKSMEDGGEVSEFSDLYDLVNSSNKKDVGSSVIIYKDYSKEKQDRYRVWMIEERLNKLPHEKDDSLTLSDEDLKHYMETGGQLSSVSDMLPTPEPMSVIQPMDITQTIDPMETGGVVTAKEKFTTVMGEFKDGTLNHGTTGETVTDRKMALAIAFSEAQEIDPTYGERKERGGDTKKYADMLMKNDAIQTILARKGTNKEKYSAMDLQTISHFAYPTRLSNILINKMWGLAQKHGFGGFENKKIQAFNVGNGDVLRYIPSNIYCVDAYEDNSDLYMISKVLFGDEKTKIHRNLSAFKKTYDLSIGVDGDLRTIVSSSILNQIKSGGLLIAVVNRDLFENDNYSSQRSKINQNYTLLEAYQLPSDIMDGFDLMILKRN
jgi:hypothetical protein